MHAGPEIEPFAPERVAQAAKLFVANYRRLRQTVPALPERHEDAASVEVMLRERLDGESGVVAVRGGELCGYMVGMGIDGFLGANRGTLCPEWCHAACGPDRARVYRCMHAALANRWVRDGRLTTAVTILADDAEAREGLFWDGFGMFVVDALRPLGPIAADCPMGLTMRRATLADVPLIAPMDVALARHLADGPVFLKPEPGDREAEYREWLARPAHALWLAMHGDEPVAYMRSQPPGFGIAHIVRDPGTVSISGAYTSPAWRGTGVTLALLARIVAAATDEGYARLSVDFESANLSGGRFWLRHFAPVCFSLVRRLDPEVLSGE